MILLWVFYVPLYLLELVVATIIFVWPVHSQILFIFEFIFAGIVVGLINSVFLLSIKRLKAKHLITFSVIIILLTICVNLFRTRTFYLIFYPLPIPPNYQATYEYPMGMFNHDPFINVEIKVKNGDDAYKKMKDISQFYNEFSKRNLYSYGETNYGTCEKALDKTFELFRLDKTVSFGPICYLNSYRLDYVYYKGSNKAYFSVRY